MYGNKVLETYKFLKENKKGEVVKNLRLFKNKITKVIKNGDFLMIKGSNATKVHELSKEFIRRAS